jgi:phosphate:Na+ symporter
MSSHNIHIWPALAGLGLFLFGMFMMEEALRGLAGRSFKLFLRRNTDTTFKAIFSGTVVTAILRSSSMVTLLVMSLAGAGIIGLKNGIGMIMGANLGTTMTGWLVALIGFKVDIEAMVLPLLAIGGLGLAFLKNEKAVNTSKLLMGFSFMFLGLNYLKESFSDIASKVDFTFLAGQPLLLFSLFGLLFTAAIQSSSLSMTIYLTSLASGIITLPQAAFLMVGSELGTTVTGLIGTLNGNAIRRKVGYSQFWFNMYSCFIALPLVIPFIDNVPRWLGQKDPLTMLVTFQTLMNLFGIIFFLPILKTFIHWIEKRVKDDDKEVSRYLKPELKEEAFTALEAVEKETQYFMDVVMTFNRRLLSNRPNQDELQKEYFILKQHENEIIDFCFHLQQNRLSENETRITDALLETVRRTALAAKDLKDVIHNLATLANSISGQDQELLQHILAFQNDFYPLVVRYRESLKDMNTDDLEHLDKRQDEFFHRETDLLYRRNHEESHEFDRTSGLNMLRGINKSNESLIKALRAMKYKGAV